MLTNRSSCWIHIVTSLLNKVIPETYFAVSIESLVAVDQPPHLLLSSLSLLEEMRVYVVTMMVEVCYQKGVCKKGFACLKGFACQKSVICWKGVA